LRTASENANAVEEKAGEAEQKAVKAVQRAKITEKRLQEFGEYSAVLNSSRYR
jgi:hypothetical protein